MSLPDESGLPMSARMAMVGVLAAIVVLIIGLAVYLNRPTPAVAGFNPSIGWEDIGQSVVTRCDHGNRVYFATSGRTVAVVPSFNGSCP